MATFLLALGLWTGRAFSLTSKSLILSSGLRSLPPDFSSRRYSSCALIPNDMVENALREKSGGESPKVKCSRK